jgi:hypothetical protein
LEQYLLWCVRFIFRGGCGVVPGISSWCARRCSSLAYLLRFTN